MDGPVNRGKVAVSRPRKAGTRKRVQLPWSPPDRAISHEGRTIIDTSGDEWLLPEMPGRRGRTLNWRCLRVSHQIEEAARAYIHYLIETRSLQTPRNYFGWIVDAMSVLPASVSSIGDFTEEVFDAVGGDLDAGFETRRSIAAWSTLRSWYLWICDRQLPGIDLRLAAKLKRRRHKAPESFLSVRRADPERGPLSDEEQYLVRQALQQRFGAVLDRVSVGLLDALGLRPKQMVLLREADFHSEGGYFWIDVEVIKRKREREKVPLAIPPDLGEAIEEIIVLNHARWPGSGNLHLILKQDSKNGAGRGGIRTNPEPVAPDGISQRIWKWARFRAAIMSPRTGKPLRLAPKRFRYTVGTVLAAQGTPARQIADILTQKGERSAQVYIDSSSAVVDRLDATLGANPTYRVAAMRFIGEIVDEGVPGRVILGTLPNLKSLGEIGNCAATFACRLQPPTTCYSCPKFQALRSADHVGMMRELIAIDRAGPVPSQLRSVIIACAACASACGQLGDEGNE